MEEKEERVEGREERGVKEGVLSREREREILFNHINMQT